MEEELRCPVCHQVVVKSTDYFCFNCGKALRPKPLSTSIPSQISLYLKSLFLPPLGIIWGFRYLRQPDRASKIVCLITIILTVVILVWAVQFTVDFINTLNNQINNQLPTLQGF